MRAGTVHIHIPPVLKPHIRAWGTVIELELRAPTATAELFAGFGMEIDEAQELANDLQEAVNMAKQTLAELRSK